MSTSRSPIDRFRTSGDLISPRFYGASALVLYAILTFVSNTFVHGIPQEISPFQILFLKSFLGVLLCTLWGWAKDPKIFETRSLPWQALRGGIGALGNIFWIAALQHLSMADASSLSLLSAVLLPIGAYLFFNERSSRGVVGAVCIGFLGVLCILRPSLQVFQMSAFYPIISAMSFSASLLVVKHVSIKDSSATTLFYLLLFMALWSFIPAVVFWKPLSAVVGLKIGLLAVFYVCVQILVVEAYTYAPAGFLSPLKFIRFPLSILSGVLFFSESPKGTTLLGGGLIIFSYLILSKTKDALPKKKAF